MSKKITYQVNLIYLPSKLIYLPSKIKFTYQVNLLLLRKFK